MSGFRSGQGGGSPTDLKPRDSVTVQGTNPKITIGDGGAEDTMLVFDGNAQDFRIGLDDGNDQLEIGHGSSHGTNTAIVVNSSGQVAKLNLPAAAVAVADDHIVILDGGATGAPKAESIQDLLSAIAGSGISVSGNQLVADGGGTADSVAADDISLGNAAVSLATSAGNITIDAQGNNTDIIFKGTDATSDITMLTLDGSEAGAATFNSTVTATGFTIGSAAITETELEILDGASVTTTELNLLDGGTSVGGSITIGDSDGFIINDGGTMKTIPASDIKTYVGNPTTFVAEDGDGTEVTISNAKQIKFVEAGGLNINWTDTDSGADGDEYDLSFNFQMAGYSAVAAAHNDSFMTLDSNGSTHQRATTATLATLFAGSGLTATNSVIAIDAAQTGITSILATDLKIGEDDETKIDFEDANKINFYANNAKEVELAENSLSPGANDGTALGTTSLGWSDLFLADEGAIKFGNDQDVTLTHVQDTGLTLDGAGSATNLQITNSATDGDAAIQFALGGTVKYTMGVNDGASDAFEINVGTGALGADTTALSIASDGSITFAGPIKTDAFSDQILFLNTNNLFSYNLWKSSASGGSTIQNTAGNVILDPADDKQVEIFTDQASAADKGASLRFTTNDGAAMAQNHRLGVLEFAGAEDASDTITVGARVEAICEQNWSGTVNDTSLMFYTTDANASQSVVLTLGSNKLATFSDDVALFSDSAVLKMGADNDVTFTHDGTTGLVIAATPITIDSTGELHLNSTTGDIKFQDGGTDQLALDLDGTAGEVIVKLMVDSDDLVFKQYDGTEVLRLDDDGSVYVKDNLSLKSDAAVIKFGSDEEITLTHVADSGLTLKHTATADDKPIVLTLATGETDIAANDVLGAINFQAPDEGTGTDAILVAAGIEAVSEGDFAADNNATKLSFKTAASAAAAETMSLSSAGKLTVSGGLAVTKTAGSATSTSGGAAAAIEQNKRAGSITITMDSGHSIGASTGFQLVTVTCDEVDVTDVIACNAINPNDGSNPVNASLAVRCVQITDGTSFVLMVMNTGSAAVPAGGGYILNWAIV